MIDQIVFVSGLAMFASAPLAGILSSRLDLQIMPLLGFASFIWMLIGLMAEWDLHDLLWPQILRGLSLMICMMPINNLALGTLSPAKIKGASGLYNLMRNLGGAVGLAIIRILSDRRHLHYTRLSEAESWSNPDALRQIDMMVANRQAQRLEGTTKALA